MPDSYKGTDILVDWVARSEDIDMRDKIGKGSTGDYHRAFYKSKEVVVKTLINQKLKETDLMKLITDASYMSKLTHPNILSFRAVCLDENCIFISQFMDMI